MTVRFHFEELRFQAGAVQRLEGDFAVLFMVVKGHATVQSETRKDELKSSQCGLYKADESFEILFASETFARSLRWSTSDDDPLSFDQIAPSWIAIRSASDHIVTLLRLGANLGNSGSEAGDRLQDAIGEATLRAYVAQNGAAKLRAVPDVIQQAKFHIEQHYCRELNLTRLAQSAGVSKEYLVSAFRRYYGVTPIRYLWEIRTQKAVRLVESTNLNLAEISEQCGYKSQFHLSREIKRATGSSPRMMRR